MYHTTFDCFNRTHVDEGFRFGLYKGWQLSYTSSLLRACMTLPALDLVRTVYPDTSNSWLQNFKAKVGVSFVASTAISLVLYPLDTAKRCMQLNGARGHAKPYEGAINCARVMLA